MSSFFQPLAEHQHGTNFSSRAAGNVEEVESFAGRAAFEAFCNIIGDRQRSAAKLAAQVTLLGDECKGFAGGNLNFEI